MLTLPRAAAAWAGAAFRPTLIDEVQTLGARDPVLRALLQAGLTQTSAVADEPLGVQVLHAREQAGRIQARIGVFYAGVIAGCNCADDPSPIDTITEHCELLLDIDPVSGRTWVSLRDD